MDRAWGDRLAGPQPADQRHDGDQGQRRAVADPLGRDDLDVPCTRSSGCNRPPPAPRGEPGCALDTAADLVMGTLRVALPGALAVQWTYVDLVRQAAMCSRP